jgi:hypothetical protein
LKDYGKEKEAYVIYEYLNINTYYHISVIKEKAIKCLLDGMGDFMKITLNHWMLRTGDGKVNRDSTSRKRQAREGKVFSSLTKMHIPPSGNQ